MAKKLDKYERLMMRYYQLLNNTWNKEIKEALKQSISSLVDLKENDLIDSVDDLVAVTAQNLSEDLRAELTKPTREFIETIYKAKLLDAMEETGINIGVGIYGLPQKSAAAKFANQNLFWIGKHFGGEVSERFKNNLVNALNDGLSKKDFAEVLVGEFKDLGRSQNYWLGLAENAEIRTKSLASIDAYTRLGITQLEIVAIIDDRTSDICREMNGRIIPIEYAQATRNSLMDVQTTGASTEDIKAQIKAIVPFFDDKKTEDIAGLSTESIMKKFPGLSLPPFHWRCRTRVAPIMGSVGGTIERGKNSDIKKDKYVKNLSPQEIRNKLNSLTNRKYFQFNQRDFLDDVDKHGRREFGLESYDYKEKAQNIVRNADRIIVRTYKGSDQKGRSGKEQLQFLFFNFEEKGYTVVDTNGMIRGCYGHLKPNGIKRCFESFKSDYFEFKE